MARKRKPSIYDLPKKRIRSVKAAVLWMKDMSVAHDNRATERASRRDYAEAHHSASCAAAYEYAWRVLCNEIE